MKNGIDFSLDTVSQRVNNDAYILMYKIHVFIHLVIMCFIYIRTLLHFVWLINSHGENILNEMVFVLNPILSEKKSSVKFKVRIIMSLCVLAKYRIPKCLLSFCHPLCVSTVSLKILAITFFKLFKFTSHIQQFMTCLKGRHPPPLHNNCLAPGRVRLYIFKHQRGRSTEKYAFFTLKNSALSW